MWNQYFTPDHLSDALELMERYQDRARIVAGGTDLVLDLASERCPPAEALVDISSISELKKITLEDGVLNIGAATTLTEILRSDILRSHFPVLTEAVRTIAGPQIRNTATIGGNVVNASPAADTVPSLLVLDAMVCIAGPAQKTREVPLSQFLLGNRKVDLRAGEIATGFHFALPDGAECQYFRKVQPRQSMAIAILNLAILLQVVDDRITDVRIAMGAVAPVAIRARAVERELRNLSVSSAKDPAIYAAVKEDIVPISDFRASRTYRLRVAERLLHESMTSLLD